MAEKKRESLSDWIGVGLLGFGAASTIGSVEWASKTNQAAYWPGYAVGLPIFIAGTLVLLWSSRRHRSDD
ncbi:MAG TPA: hypothetical protein VFW73_08940 [Lacipirellulaceae bacterium]|nr:hypothetical protein [Lacipirellulaceae bacterium]